MPTSTVKLVSLADMASETNWPDPRDVAHGVKAMTQIARQQGDVTLAPKEMEALAICIGAVGLAVGRIKARQEINGILEHRN